MISRRSLFALPALAAAAGNSRFELCMHQTTSAGSDFRRSLEGYAKAGFRIVEITPPILQPFVDKEGLPAAKRLLSDLGLKAVSSSGSRGLAEPGDQRPKALTDLKHNAELAAELGINRLVSPCVTSAKYTLDDYKRGVDNLREAGDVVKPLGIVAMVEFTRGSTFIGTLPTSLRMTREAAHSHVKPMFDCYHFWAGLSKLGDIEDVHPGEIHHVHFQDVPDMPRELLDSTTREIPGKGISPLSRILSGLAEKGYSGPLSVELFYPKYQQTDPYEMAIAVRSSAQRFLL